MTEALDPTAAKEQAAYPQEAAAKVTSAAVSKPRSVKARVLLACTYGQPDDVVTLAPGIAKSAEAAGQVDTDQSAVAYAMTLEQNKA